MLCSPTPTYPPASLRLSTRRSQSYKARVMPLCALVKNNAETHIKLNNQGIISALQRLIELSNNKNDIAKYQEKVAETHKELELIEASIRIYKNDVDAMTIEIKHLMDMLLVKAKELFDLSILLMKEKENMLAEKFL